MSVLVSNNFVNNRTFILFSVAFIVVTLIIEISPFIEQKILSSAVTDFEIDTTSSFPRQLNDAIGDHLIIPSRPQRIVSQTLATDEILLAICPASRIMAVSALARDSRYSNVTKQAIEIAGQTSNNVEHILSFDPDLIFVASYSRVETVKLLQSLDVPVFRFANFQSIADIKSNIKTVGYAIGEDQRAANLVAQMERAITLMRASIPNRKVPPRIMSYTVDNYTAGSHTTFDAMVNIVGAINLAVEHDITQHIKISSEQVLAWQPDFIVTHAYQGNFAEAHRQLLAKPAIAASNAGKNKRIIVIENRYFMSVSQYIVYGIKQLFDGLYSFPNK